MMDLLPFEFIFHYFVLKKDQSIHDVTKVPPKGEHGKMSKITMGAAHVVFITTFIYLSSFC